MHGKKHRPWGRTLLFAFGFERNLYREHSMAFKARWSSSILMHVSGSSLRERTTKNQLANLLPSCMKSCRGGMTLLDPTWCFSLISGDQPQHILNICSEGSGQYSWGNSVSCAINLTPFAHSQTHLLQPLTDSPPSAPLLTDTPPSAPPPHPIPPTPAHRHTSFSPAHSQTHLPWKEANSRREERNLVCSKQFAN